MAATNRDPITGLLHYEFPQAVITPPIGSVRSAAANFR
jgi:hypothetical protein